jgi:hypothetical protein
MTTSESTHDARASFRGTLTKVLMVQAAALALLGLLQLFYTR